MSIPQQGQPTFQVCAFKFAIFLLLNILELGPLFSPVFCPSFLLSSFLNSWSKIPGPYIHSFLLPFSFKALRKGGGGHGSYLMNLVFLGQVWQHSFCSRFASSSFFLLVSPPPVNFPPILALYSLHVCSYPASSQALPSLSHAWGTCSRVVELSLGKRKEQEHASHFGKREGGQEHASRFGKSGESPFLSPCIYSPQSVRGCLGPRLSLPSF